MMWVLSALSNNVQEYCYIEVAEANVKSYFYEEYSALSNLWNPYCFGSCYVTWIEGTNGLTNPKVCLCNKHIHSFVEVSLIDALYVGCI